MCDHKHKLNSNQNPDWTAIGTLSSLIAASKCGASALKAGLVIKSGVQELLFKILRFLLLIRESGGETANSSSKVITR